MLIDALSPIRPSVVLYASSTGTVYLYLDNDEIWWFPKDKPSQLLTESDSLCGAGFFETGPFDPFRDCCAWHDHAYTNRKFFEERGWNRESVDAYFYSLMLQRAGNDKILALRAKEYYTLVRTLGWIFYYRHPGLTDNECDRAQLFALADKHLEELQSVTYGTSEGK